MLTQRNASAFKFFNPRRERRIVRQHLRLMLRNMLVVTSLVSHLFLSACVGDAGGSGYSPGFPFSTRLGHITTDTPAGHARRGVDDGAFDIDCQTGEAVGSIASGFVTEYVNVPNPPSTGFGNLIVVTDPVTGFRHKMTHFSYWADTPLSEGMWLNQGQIAGLCGATGSVIPLSGDGSHVHVSVTDVNGNVVDLNDPSDWAPMASLEMPSPNGAPVDDHTLDIGAPASAALDPNTSYELTCDASFDGSVQFVLFKGGIQPANQCVQLAAQVSTASCAIGFSPVPEMGNCVLDSTDDDWYFGASRVDDGSGIPSAFAGPYTFVAPDAPPTSVECDIWVTYPGGQSFGLGDTISIEWDTEGDCDDDVAVRIWPASSSDSGSFVNVEVGTNNNDGHVGGVVLSPQTFTPGLWHVCVSEVDGTSGDCGDDFAVTAVDGAGDDDSAGDDDTTDDDEGTTGDDDDVSGDDDTVSATLEICWDPPGGPVGAGELYIQQSGSFSYWVSSPLAVASPGTTVLCGTVPATSVLPWIDLKVQGFYIAGSASPEWLGDVGWDPSTNLCFAEPVAGTVTVDGVDVTAAMSVLPWPGTDVTLCATGVDGWIPYAAL